MQKNEWLSQRYGAEIYLKREDLLHGGAHKTNQVLGQGLLAKRLGKTRLIAETDVLLALAEVAEQHRYTVMVGRSHGVHAEPTTFGAKVALWALQVDRDRTRLRAARDTVAVMKLSGAVGGRSATLPP